MKLQPQSRDGKLPRRHCEQEYVPKIRTAAGVGANPVAEIHETAGNLPHFLREIASLFEFVKMRSSAAATELHRNSRFRTLA